MKKSSWIQKNFLVEQSEDFKRGVLWALDSINSSPYAVLQYNAPSLVVPLASIKRLAELAGRDELFDAIERLKISGVLKHEGSITPP